MFLLTEQRDLLENFRVPRIYFSAVARTDTRARFPLCGSDYLVFFAYLLSRAFGFRLLFSTQRKYRNKDHNEVFEEYTDIV